MNMIPITVSESTHSGLGSASVFTTRINIKYDSFFLKVVRELDELNETEWAIDDPNAFKFVLKKTLLECGCGAPVEYEFYYFFGVSKIYHST